MTGKPFDDVAADLYRHDPALVAEMVRSTLADGEAGEIATLHRQLIKAGLVTAAARIEAGAGLVLSPKQP